jgi:Kinesin motor domain
MQLVDLAGSERSSQTGNTGLAAKEAIDINKSLFTLRQVITSLAEGSKNKKSVAAHIPYRDSKLTSLLKQSLGGNSYSLMIACLSPSDTYAEENVSTLNYATKASHIQN